MDTEVLDAPQTGNDAPPPTTQINRMAEAFKNLVENEVNKPPAPDKPIDTTPKPLPEAKKEPPKEPLKTEPLKEAEITKPKPSDWQALQQSRDEWKRKAETFSKEKVDVSSKLEKEINDYKAKLVEFETKSAKPEEVEALRKERQALQEKVERLDLASSEKFSSYYNSKFEQAVTQAVDAVGKDKTDQIKTLLEAPKSAWRKAQLNEIVGAMESEVDKLQLIAAMTEYDRTRSERDKQLDDHKVNLSKLREVQQQQQREAQERDVARRKGIVTDVIRKAADSFEVFKEKEGDADHNAAVSKAHKLVEDFVMGTLDDSVAISLPLKAAEYDRVSKLIPTLQAKIKEQEEALANYKQAAPKGGEIPPGQKPASDRPKTFKEQVLEMMPRSQ